MTDPQNDIPQIQEAQRTASQTNTKKGWWSPKYIRFKPQNIKNKEKTTKKPETIEEDSEKMYHTNTIKNVQG